MNDFTKEELEDLISWGEVYTEFGNSWADKVHRPLIEKIQAMIDNYCEHDPKASSISYTNYFCTKCGREIA